ncbi:MAG: hypothetical protein K9M98_07955 [Cephaloticoccus sp.]|nr:hypothetical protein [Cephaloticoccus sp.]
MSNQTSLRGPIFNQDSTEFFFTHGPDEVSAAAVDAYIDQLAAAGIGTFISCLNAMKANFASKVWETDWHGYDPKGPDDQPVLHQLPAAAIPGTRKRLDSAKHLAESGVDFHSRALARCRHHGIGAWVSVRMNDVHDCVAVESPLLSTFFKAQREAKQLRAPHRQSDWWADHGLDWERADVQEHYFKFVQEQLATRDIDGLELDWMRFVFHFRPGRELAGGQAITAWMQRVRAECDQAEQRLGHPVKLGVRVPSRPETARRCGLDGVAWARAGLIDLLVPTPFWATTDFDMPLCEWRRLVDGTRVHLAGGLEIRYQPVPNGPAGMMTPELAAGAAMNVLHGGADSVYLFNYFPSGHSLAKDWGWANINAGFRAMQDAAKLQAVPRTHAVTFHDVRAPGEAADNALPGVDTKLDFQWPPGCAFRVQTGPKPGADRRAELLLEFERAPAARDEIQVFLNSQRVTADSPTPERIMRFLVPAATISDEAQVVELVAGPDVKFRVLRVEVSFAAA